MFKKNNSGNPNGRPVGAKGKAPCDIKQAFQTLIEGNLGNVENWPNAVAIENPAKALELLLKLSEFCVPKQKAVELKPSNDCTFVVTIGGDNEIND